MKFKQILRWRCITCWQDTKFLKKFHGWSTVGWLVASPLLAWKFGNSVFFVTLISLYAIVTGHWSSWQSGRVEEKQDRSDK